MPPHQLAVALLVLAALALTAGPAAATELTFEMEPHETQCYYEVVDKGSKMTLEYQVVYGGRLDIDVVVKGDNQEIYNQRRSQTGAHMWTASEGGEISICFGNEFSTIAHKTVYFDLIKDTDDNGPVLDSEQHHATLTQMETSLTAIHDSLKKVVDYQTHHRMRETFHRHTAEYINSRVQYVSAAEALLLVFISLFQVVYLRSLFSDKPNRW